MRAADSDDTCLVIAGGHCDRKTTALVGTRGMSTPGQAMTRYWRAWINGVVESQQYTLH